MPPPLITRFAKAPTIASTTTIAVTQEYVRVSGTNPIATITPKMAGVNQLLYIVPTAAYTFTTAGNIAITATGVIGKLHVLLYDSVTAKWYPSY